MPKFSYVARDKSGKPSAGVIQAADEQELRRILRMNDLYLTQVRGSRTVSSDPPSRAQKAATTPLFVGRPNIQDLTIAMRQLSTLIRAGMPITETLQIVGAQTNKPLLTNAFYEIEQLVVEGQTMSTGMRRYPELFNALVVSLVEAGEVAGTLDQTLDVAAMQLDREAVLRSKVKAAMLYPKLVIVACVGTISVMLLLVVPTFATVYKQLHADLPWETTMLMSVSAVFVRWWWLMILLVVGAAYGYRAYANTGPGRRRLDIMGIKAPLLGPLLRKMAIARFVQTLSGAMKGGVPVLRSLGIAANTAGNTVIRDAITEVALKVRDGAPIGTELANTGEFPAMVSRMIAAGEASGNIDTMLDEINKFYERDVEYATERITRIIEPLMTVLVGAIVLVVLLALYMPVFNLGKAFTGQK